MSSLFGKLHVRRHDADDGHDLAVGFDHAAKDGGIAPVAFFPHAVRKERDGLGALLIIGIRETASEDRPFADQRKQAGGDVGPSILFGCLSFFAEVDVRADHAGNVRKRLRPLAPVVELRIRHTVSLAFRVHHAHGDDPVRIVEGQAAKQDRVDEGEDGRVGADTERQGGCRGEGEPPILDQQTGREPDILPQHHRDLGASASGSRLPAPALLKPEAGSLNLDT